MSKTILRIKDCLLGLALVLVPTAGSAYEQVGEPDNTSYIPPWPVLVIVIVGWAIIIYSLFLVLKKRQLNIGAEANARAVGLWTKIEHTWFMGAIGLVFAAELVYLTSPVEDLPLLADVYNVFANGLFALLIFGLPAWFILRPFYIWFFTDKPTRWRRCDGKVAKYVSYILIPISSVLIYLFWVAVLIVGGFGGYRGGSIEGSTFFTTLFFLWLWYLAIRSCVTTIIQSNRQPL